MALEAYGMTSRRKEKQNGILSKKILRAVSAYKCIEDKRLTLPYICQVNL